MAPVATDRSGGPRNGGWHDGLVAGGAPEDVSHAPGTLGSSAQAAHGGGFAEQGLGGVFRWPAGRLGVAAVTPVQSMPGFDLRVALRKALGGGEIPSLEAIADALRTVDADGDGALTQEEILGFFVARRVAGKWLAELLAKASWQIAEHQAKGTLDTLPIETIAWAIHDAASHPLRPERRYIIDPEEVLGLKVDDMLSEPTAAGAPSKPPPEPQSGRPEPRRPPRPRPRRGARPRGRKPGRSR